MYDHKHESDYYQRKQNNARYIHLIHNFTLCNAENHSDTAYKKRHYPRNSTLHKHCYCGRTYTSELTLYRCYSGNARGVQQSKYEEHDSRERREKRLYL